MSGNLGTSIQLNRHSIAISALWATQLEISSQPQQLENQSYTIRSLFLEHWSKIHLAEPGPAGIYWAVLLSCINTDRDQVTECPGSGQVARVASMCLLRTLANLFPGVASDFWIRQRYVDAIPHAANFEGLSCFYTMSAIHAIVISRNMRRSFEWADYKPCAREHMLFAATLVQAAYTRARGKVPRWILRFAIDSLSRDPPPPTSVILDCLAIIAADLRCNVSSARTTALDKRYVQHSSDFTSLTQNSSQLEQVSRLITQELKALVEESAIPDHIHWKHKALSALFPYAVRQEQEGQPEILDLILRAASAGTLGASGFMWRRFEPLAARLIEKESTFSAKRATILVLPHVHWEELTNGEHLIRLWAAAASALPYADDIGKSVVDTLLRIASLDSTSPHIPIDMWSWLNKRPPLYPNHWGYHPGTRSNVMRAVRGLGVIELLKSYFLIVWSERVQPPHEGFLEVCASIRENFSGTGMRDHRQDLLQRLDYVLRELDLGLEHLQRHDPGLREFPLSQMKEKYRELKEVLLEADAQEMDHTDL